MGYPSASYVPETDKTDIRKVMQEEVATYRKKFLIALLLNIPILVLMWVIPYAKKEWVTDKVIVNGIPLYIFILLGFSTVIQFYSGAAFYKGSYKSVRNCSANMDVLVVLGTTAAWLYGVILIFVGNEVQEINDSDDDHALHLIVHEHGHNFEISATLIMVILFGKFLESFSKKQTVEKLS